MIKVAKKLLKGQLDEEPLDIPDEPVKKKAKKKPTFLSMSDKAVQSKLGISAGFCLLTELHRNMSSYDKDRPYINLHASDVTKDEPVFCPRERALLVKTNAEPNEKYISTETRTYFDVGESIHDLVREKWGVAVSVGDWECLKCGGIHKASLKPTLCECGGKRFQYNEQRVLSSDTGISCGIDWQVLEKGTNYSIAVEIKSMNPTDFKTLAAPLAEHSSRTKLYLQSIATATDQKAVAHLRKDMAYILYVTKGAPIDGEILGGGGFIEKRTPFRLYTVMRDDASIEQYLNRGREYTEFKKTKKLPERICATPLTKRAKKCSMCTECWKA
ncbi:rubredoxin-type fold protein [Vibrio phage vB_VpS_PG28]|nr:rubredoxin-type fold protein [Vibrio phage vB_VpS_PG28]